MSLIDGIEHGRPVLFIDSRLLCQACRGAVQGSSAAEVGCLCVYRLEQIRLQGDAPCRSR